MRGGGGWLGSKHVKELFLLEFGQLPKEKVERPKSKYFEELLSTCTFCCTFWSIFFFTGWLSLWKPPKKERMYVFWEIHQRGEALPIPKLFYSSTPTINNRRVLKFISAKSCTYLKKKKNWIWSLIAQIKGLDALSTMPKTPDLLNAPFKSRKIQHTGDTKSLDMCG